MKKRLGRNLVSSLIALILAVSVPGTNGAQEKSEQLSLKKVEVKGIELHYAEQGKGIPIIFIHGGLGDYRSWATQVKEFSQKFRAITYSRRYNYPNGNSMLISNHSAIIEAEDLAGMIKNLKLERVYLVGASYGALTALFLAYKHPEMMRAMVLAEPPMLKLIADTPEGKEVFAEVMNMAWEPTKNALKKGDKEQSLKPFVDYLFGEGTFERTPAALRAVMSANIREFEAFAHSKDHMPLIPRERLKKIATPTLMLSGERTAKIHKLIDDQLEKLLPNVERVTINGANHSMWLANPTECKEKTLEFLSNK
jgi:pimeloyl-ACP methyl ester carboxylesterase